MDFIRTHSGLHPSPRSDTRALNLLTARKLNLLSTIKKINSERSTYEHVGQTVKYRFPKIVYTRASRGQGDREKLMERRKDQFQEMSAGVGRD
jgi:hypothetical protein